jgi:LysR family glycine cleavage system transcriptional activator
MPHLPPLAAIRCFEAAARHQSFTRAAEELGMTQAAVSYQLKILEERLGGPLFLRGARGVTLTDSGRRLAPAVTDAFAKLRAAFEELSQSSGGVLSITTLASFATSWLVPRLGAFQLAHPDIAVKLDVSGGLVDFAREEMDVGIRTGHGDWPGLTGHRLFAVAFTPMLSPRLLDKLGPLESPADLPKFPLLDPTDAWWSEWFLAAGMEPPDLSQRTEMRVFYQNLAGTAALAGQGVAMLTPAFFADELRDGRLVQPFPFIRESGSHYWLVYPQARRRSPKIRAFRDWILETTGSAE